MVYLDYAATVPMLPEVREAMRKAEERFFANASALHTPGHLAMNEIERCRGLLAELIGAKPKEIIFTSGASESNNTVVRTFEGCQIETSPLEHHSVIETAKVYAGDKLPKLYSYMLANNETGEFLNLPSGRVLPAAVLPHVAKAPRGGPLRSRHPSMRHLFSFRSHAGTREGTGQCEKAGARLCNFFGA